MSRINLTGETCAKCDREFDDIAVWIEFEEMFPSWKGGTYTVMKPVCRSCYTFADMQKADTHLVCDGCGIKAAMPEMLARWQVPWNPKTGYDYSRWVCSPCCRERQRRKDRRWKQRTCEVCKKPFTAARIDARFCSNACRQWAYRRAHQDVA